MRIGFAVLYALVIIIPTTLLAYFGLLAVRSEKSIVESNMMQKYESMASLVEGEFTKALSDAQKELLDNPKYVEHMIIEQSAIFKEDVAILDSTGKSLSEEKGPKPVFVKQIKGFPYRIAVYERYPVILSKIDERRRHLSLYIGIIYLSAVLILSGAFVTLWALSRQWNLAQLKNEFVSHLAHDLRRPLTSIRMFTEMLQTGRVADDGKRKEYYGIISNESERLTLLANNILDFSRIEMGRKNYNIKKEDLARIINETVDRFRSYMIDVPRQVSVDIEENLPTVNADASAISQVIMNLLTNAAKYSPQDSIISVKAARADRNITVCVVDHGIGVPKGELKKIFRKFYRTRQNEVSEAEGSGLGLTLVKYIAEAHGGQIRAESEEGKGSRFTLVLPV
ncbi:MAG: HAMP domain-containing sensor histidine kinase [Dehalococcoidales bacterium]|jgi:signal transduction histidine kinase